MHDQGLRGALGVAAAQIDFVGIEIHEAQTNAPEIHDASIRHHKFSLAYPGIARFVQQVDDRRHGVQPIAALPFGFLVGMEDREKAGPGRVVVRLGFVEKL